MSTKITLAPGKQQSLERRHPWIFSGAISHMEGEPDEGDIVEVYAHDGKFLGRGHCQIGSIAVRMLTFNDTPVDESWWSDRISDACKVRRSARIPWSDQTDCYRLVHGEGDFLPGLIVDMYAGVAVIQCHSVGMYRSREQIVKGLKNVMGESLTAIYDKSSQTVPPKAGLGAVDGYLYGGVNSPTEACRVREGGYDFLVNWQKGQKTGFFLDQRDNRALLGHYAKGRKVLNTFSYTGGFSVYALGGGATHVDSIDSSAFATGLASANVRLNFGEDAPHGVITADVMDYIREMPDDYDLIVLDPPAFAKHQKSLSNATQAYRRLNARAISKIRSGGIIFTFSCSQAVSRDLFRTTVFSAAAIAGRKVRILHQLTQPADHPVNIYHPEGEYLKGLVLYVE